MFLSLIQFHSLVVSLSEIFFHDVHAHHLALKGLEKLYFGKNFFLLCVLTSKP